MTVHILQQWVLFNVETFELIVQSGFAEHWYTRPIPRTDSSSHGEPRPGARSLDAWGALGLVLHYLNSTMLEEELTGRIE